MVPADYYASNSMDIHPAEGAFDLNHKTMWHSKTNNAYLVVKLKHPSKLRALSIIRTKLDIPGLHDELIIEGSNDNNNWEFIKGFSQLVWKPDRKYTVLVESNNKDYKYYKFNFKRKKETSLISIVEMDLYNSKDKDGEDSNGTIW